MPEIIVKLGDNVVQKYFFFKDVVTVGRSPENEVAIENLAVSRKHATISRRDGQYFLEDHGSANGTYVNGTRVARTAIIDKDVITIGKHKLYFYNGQAAVAAPDLSQRTMLVDHVPELKPILRILQGKQKGEVYHLNRTETRIGRAADNEIRLSDWFVSKHHAIVIRKGGSYFIRDLASWRHTLVNGAIVEEIGLKAGDQVQLGPKIQLAFEYEKPAGFEEPPSSFKPFRASDESALPLLSGNGASASTPLSIARSMAAGMDDSEFPLQVPSHTAPEPIEEARPEVPVSGPVPIDFTDEPCEVAVSPGGDPAPETASNDVLATPVSPEQNDGVAAEAPVSVCSAAKPDEGSEIIASVSHAVSAAAAAETEEVALWLRALQNPSSVIRKQAKRKLRVLTGRDYDVE